MKLYATVTSERASKGQGGKHLDIEVRNESRELIFSYINDGEGNQAIGYLENKQWIVDEITKGEKQKGALCGNCYKREANIGDTLCEPCAKQNAQ